MNVFDRSPDYGKAMKAAEKIFELLNLKPSIDNLSNTGDKIVRIYSNYFQSILYSSYLV